MRKTQDIVFGGIFILFFILPVILTYLLILMVCTIVEAIYCACDFIDKLRGI